MFTPHTPHPHRLVEELDHIPLFTEYLAQKCKGLTVTDLVAEAVPMAAADWFNDVVVTPSHTSTLAEVCVCVYININHILITFVL